MSGPKISVYSLTGRAREIVTGQMRCEQQSLICHKRTKDLLQSVRPLFESLKKQLNNMRLLAKRMKEGAAQAEELQALCRELCDEEEEIRKEITVHVPHASAKYRITEEALAEKQEELKRLKILQERAEALQEKLETAAHQEKRSHAEVQKKDVENVMRIQDSIASDLSNVSSFEFELEEIADTSFQDKKDAVKKELSELLRDNTLPKHLMTEIKNALSSLRKIEEESYLNTFDAVTVMGIFKKIDAFKREEEQKTAEFNELFARYEALCAMAGEDAKLPPDPSTPAAAVNAEVERLELLLVRQQEQAYISECVDEVMADMGYDLIGSRTVRKRSGKQYRNELFTFNEGTAVNVTYAPDGQISMELGGLAREDRIPTADESEVLTRDMESFCGEFREFERRMLEKGVVVGNRIALAPPAAEYASIINVNDYDVDTSTQITVMNAAEKRRKQAERKVMRRSE